MSKEVFDHVVPSLGNDKRIGHFERIIVFQIEFDGNSKLIVNSSSKQEECFERVVLISL